MKNSISSSIDNKFPITEDDVIKAQSLWAENIINIGKLYIKKGNYKESDPVRPFNNYGLSKLGGECAVSMYKNSLILRITMTEKPFLYKKAYDNLKSNFMFHEDLVNLLPKLLNKKGIINTHMKKHI